MFFVFYYVPVFFDKAGYAEHFMQYVKIWNLVIAIATVFCVQLRVNLKTCFSYFVAFIR